MHCHLIVSWKDQSNKKKLSPLTNHKNTKKGAVKGDFDRKNLFQQAKQGFDRLFGHKWELAESFAYYNTMKNSSISDQINMQERQISGTEIQPANQPNVGTAIQRDIPTLQQTENKQPSINVPDIGLPSVFALLTLDTDNRKEEQAHVKRKKKKPKRGFKR